MYKVYILQSLKDSRTYVGYTNDIENRLKDHNSRKVSATCNRRPFKIVYLESVESLKMAKIRENYWKSGAGRRKLKHYFNEGFPPIGMGEARSK